MLRGSKALQTCLQLRHGAKQQVITFAAETGLVISLSDFSGAALHTENGISTLACTSCITTTYVEKKKQKKKNSRFIRFNFKTFLLTSLQHKYGVTYQPKQSQLFVFKHHWKIITRLLCIVFLFLPFIFSISSVSVQVFRLSLLTAKKIYMYL